MFYQLKHHYQREIHLLAAAFKERIHFDLVEFSPWLPYEQLCQILTERLYKNCGMQKNT